MKLFIAFVSLLLASCISVGQSPGYVLHKRIPLAGDAGYDYLYVDQPNQRLYVSHGNRVHAIDLSTFESVGTIDSLQGVHGIAVVSDLNQGFISDGRANAIRVFDLHSLKSIANIPLSGKNPDAIIYDPFSKKIFAFNHSSNNVSIVDPRLRTEIQVLELGGSPEFAVSDGKGKIFNNLEDKNSLVVINTATMKVENSYNLSPCEAPTGLAIDLAGKRLFSVCSENKAMSVVNMQNGKVITTVPIGAGVDAVAYDPGSKLIFSSNGEGTVTIIRQQTPDQYSVVQTLQTQVRARTMALDPKTHSIFLSVAEPDTGTRRIKPGTFTVLVYNMQQ
jgi:DNA-binding beta-propeller fold protein YncE